MNVRVQFTITIREIIEQQELMYKGAFDQVRGDAYEIANALDVWKEIHDVNLTHDSRISLTGIVSDWVDEERPFHAIIEVDDMRKVYPRADHHNEALFVSVHYNQLTRLER